MKIKFLIVAGLILAIMTAGAVCAGENVTSDDTLALDDTSDIEKAVEEDVLSDTPTKDDFKVEFSNTTAVNSPYDVITVYKYNASEVEGNLTVSVDGGEPSYNKEFKYYGQYLNITDLGIDTPGIYALKLNFLPVGKSPILLLDSKLNVTEREGYGNITAHIYNAAYTSSWEEDLSPYFVDIYNFPSNGTALVYVDGKLQYNGTSNHLSLKDMNEKPSIGRHYVSVKWWNGKNETPVKSRMIDVSYYFGLEYDFADTFYIGEDAKFHIRIPNDATGDVYVTVAGKTEKVACNGTNYITYVLKTSSFKPNTYKFHMELKNDPFYPARTFETDIYIIPEITYHDLAVGETGYVSIYLPKSFKGTLNLYKTKKYAKYGKPIKSVKVKNGRADIPLCYSKTGSKYLIAEYVTGKYSYDSHLSFDIKKNYKKVSASVSAKTIKAGKKVKLTIKGPVNFGQFFDIFVDNDLVKTKDLKNGKATFSVSFKTTGTHHIKVITDYPYGKFFSKTFKIKVKKPDVQLKLKKASVKKSAKKLTIKSTLKIKGKAKKGLKVKFKFNKKTYTAKTNKKGIAKITIKKSVLKKLKVGANVNYQASYKKTVVKKSAIVKD